MSLTNRKANYKKDPRGFTLVELLIVIVVIAILAAITIVSYNGVTARANTTSSQSAASNFAKKAELYNADGGNNRYPATAAELTGAASTTSYNLTGVTPLYQATPLLTSASSNSTIRVLKCAAVAGATTQAVITGTSTGNNKLSGLRIYYFDYAANAETTTPINIGVTTNCPTTN